MSAKRYWISRDTPSSEIPATSGKMVAVVLASDYEAIVADRDLWREQCNAAREELRYGREREEEGMRKAPKSVRAKSAEEIDSRLNEAARKERGCACKCPFDLRRWYKGMAMAAIVAPGTTAENIAELAGKMADALMAEDKEATHGKA